MPFARARRHALIAAMAAAALVALTGCTFGSAGDAGAAGEAGEAAAPPRAAAEVRTLQGEVAGLALDEVDAYLGIPYAAPPVGDRRWQEPQPARSWEGVLDARVPGPDCPQGVNGDSDGSVNENCLYLNVYAPAAPASEKLPVVVFLHGGGHTYGTPNIYDGEAFAATGDAIVVIPAFRVGVFGFFGTPGTAAEGEFGAQGNWGMLDQQQALRWVQDNIDAFGGDPGNVTIVGESAGGSSVCFQLASPTAAGLFQRAVIQSSGCGGLAEASSAPEFAEKWGCDPADMECLRDVDTATIVGSVTGFGVARPTIGGPDLPVAPLEAAASGGLAEVPVIIGVTRDEWVGFESGSYPLDPAEYEARVRDEFGAKADEILEAYPADAGPDPIFAMGWLRGDAMFACPSIESADAFTAAGRDVHFYEFADRTAPGWRSLGDPFPPSALELGATHTTELQYLFGYDAAQRPLDATQRELAADMVDSWIRFAAEGSPKEVGGVDWPSFGADRGVLVLQGDEAGGILVSDDFEARHHCGLWK